MPLRTLKRAQRNNFTVSALTRISTQPSFLEKNIVEIIIFAGKTCYNGGTYPTETFS